MSGKRRRTAAAVPSALALSTTTTGYCAGRLPSRSRVRNNSLRRLYVSTTMDRRGCIISLLAPPTVPNSAPAPRHRPAPAPAPTVPVGLHRRPRRGSCARRGTRGPARVWPRCAVRAAPPAWIALARACGGTGLPRRQASVLPAAVQIAAIWSAPLPTPADDRDETAPAATATRQAAVS